MAYNRTYASNPDALPAFVEPEQAAQMLSNTHITSPSARPSSAAPLTGRRPLPNSYPSQGPAPGRPNAAQNGPARYSNPPGSGPSPGPGPAGPRYGTPQAPPPQIPRPPSYGYGAPPGPGPGPKPNLPLRRTPVPQPPTPPSGNSTAPLTRDEIWPLFSSVDQERTGQLSEQALSRALLNADYSSFDPHTVRMMIRMFDTDRSGTISFDEFVALWTFLTNWRSLFARFDVDDSGTISLDEFRDALVVFGYKLSPRFVETLFDTFARESGTPVMPPPPPPPAGLPFRSLSFDLFVQACISLKRMTDVFKKYDEDRDGYITLSFEDFLTGAQSLFLFDSISPDTDRNLY